MLSARTPVLPSWPEHAAMTVFMTPPNLKGNPLPTEVLYDWSRKAQRTRMFTHLGTEDALLLDGHGYGIVSSRGRRRSCDFVPPGAIPPNWPQTGGCGCEAVINGNTALTPFGTARIMVCPMTKPRVVWAWFAHNDRPMVFMETSAPGDEPGDFLALADYYTWVPGYLPESSAFDLPAQCLAPKAAAAPQPRSRHAMEPDGPMPGVSSGAPLGGGKILLPALRCCFINRPSGGLLLGLGIMKNAFIETCVVCLCAFLFSSSAAFGEEGDASRGSALFRDQCALCHINEGRGGQGPNLRGIVGRKPASTDFGLFGGAEGRKLDLE